VYEIKIKGEARANSNIHDCDFISDPTCFCDYIDNDFGALSGGFLMFRVEDDILWSITSYKSSRELTEAELKQLSEYTQGQWSDGVGEVFEQMPCGKDRYGEDIYISAWHPGQELIVEQIKVN